MLHARFDCDRTVFVQSQPAVKLCVKPGSTHHLPSHSIRPSASYATDRKGGPSYYWWTLMLHWATGGPKDQLSHPPIIP